MSKIAFTVMTWNIASFGATSANEIFIDNEWKNVLHEYIARKNDVLVNAVANYILTSKVDIVIIQELFVDKNINEMGRHTRPTGDARVLVNNLLQTLRGEDKGANWRQAYSNANARNATRDAYLFLWKATPSGSNAKYISITPNGTVPADTITVFNYQQKATGNQIEILSENYKGEVLHFGGSRKPGCGVFQFSYHGNTTVNNCMIASLHAISPKRTGKGLIDSVSPNVHKGAINDCIQAITAATKTASDALKLGSLMPILVGGDFNFNLNDDYYNNIKGQYAKTQFNKATKKNETVEKTSEYKLIAGIVNNTKNPPPPTTLNYGGPANAYDNFLTSAASTPITNKSWSVLGQNQKKEDEWSGVQFVRFKNNISDHLPVIATFTFPDPNKLPTNS